MEEKYHGSPLPQLALYSQMTSMFLFILSNLSMKFCAIPCSANRAIFSLLSLGIFEHSSCNISGAINSCLNKIHS